MARAAPPTVLFLAAAGDARGAAAEASFNAVAARMGLPWRGRCLDVDAAAEADLQGAVAVVVLDEAARVLERFASCADRVRPWRAGPDGVEREVMGLVAALLGGRAEFPAPPAEAPAPPKKPAERPVVRVGRETKGRRGKGVTTVFDLPLSASEIEKLAARLKAKCGTGGTVKDGVIEIQGDHRDRLVSELEGLGYRVKRVAAKRERGPHAGSGATVTL